MSDLLYLDTARYGRICSRAHRAAEALARLSAAEGCSPAFETLLRKGFLAWPAERRLAYQGLADWKGVGELKGAVKSFLRAGRQSEVHLANRSGFLLSLAARALFARCRRVLATDLDWPAYLASLAAAAAKAGGELVTVSLRASVFGDRADPAEVAGIVRDEYARSGCDGLFMSSVTNTGVRLPVREVIAGLRRDRAGPNLTVVDGTQAVGLVDEDLQGMRCDIYLAGFHKWLRAQSPLGVAITPTPNGSLGLERARRDGAAAGEPTDPLFEFTRDLQRRESPLERFGETVNAAPLFTARAALADPLANLTPVVEQNARRVREAAEGTSWQKVETHPSLATGILLYQPAGRVRKWNSDRVRQRFHEAGVAITTYDGGLVRISSPKAIVPGTGFQRLRRALMGEAVEKRAQLIVTTNDKC